MSATEGAGGGIGGDKSSSSGNSSSAAAGATGKPVTSGAGAGGQLTATAVIGGGGMSAATTPIPIDLASASKVLVRPEKTTMPTTTYRFGSNAGSQMRVVIPSSAAPQTFYRQPANIKQDTTTNRTQISAIPAARTVTQTTSLTVSRAPQTTPTTVSYHVSNRVSGTQVVAANLQATARATTINGPIRISTPPIQVATNSTTTYVQRQPATVVPSRNATSSATNSGSSPTAATIISQNSAQNATTTLVPNFQMSTQLIRANSITAAGVAGGVAGVAPRARVVTQTTLPANHHQVSLNSGSGGGSTVVSGVSGTVTGAVGSSQTIAIGGAAGGGVGTAAGSSVQQAGQPQAFVATLSAVLQAPRQVSTLVYTNNSNAQQYTIGPNQQRLALATTLSPQRPAQATTVTTGIRPTIQRLPTTAAGIRVSNGSLNFRPPVLASTTVLTTIASGGTGTVGTVTNSQQQQQQQVQTVQQIQQQQRTVTAAGVAAISNSIPARIIQVQNTQSGAAGTAQILNGRIQTNLLNIQPLIVSNNRLNQGALQPGLTIAQVSKLTPVATGGVGGPGSTGGGDGGVGVGGPTTTTLQTASGQQIVVSTGGVGGTIVGGGGGGTSAAILTGSLITTNQSGGVVSQTSAHPGQITQIVNVNAPTVVSVATGGVGGTTQQQQIVTVSQAGCGVSSTGATVIPIPLALTSARSVGGGVAAGHSPLSIVSGGIMRTAGGAGGAGVATSISSVLPIAKVTPQQQGLVSIESNVGGGGTLVTQHYSVAGGASSGGGPSLYIQTRPQPGGTGATGTIIAASSTGGSALSSNSAKGGATLSVVSSSSGHGQGAGGGGAGGGTGASATTFLPTSTFYYERLTSSPATSHSSIVPSSTSTVSIASGTVSSSSSSVTFVQSASTPSIPSSTTITTTSAISGPVFSIPSSSSVISSGVGAGSGSSTTVVTVAGSSNPSLTPYGSSGSFAIVQASAATLQSASSTGANAGRSSATLTSGPIHGIVPASIQGGGATVTGSIVSVAQQSSVAALTGSASSTTQIVPIRFHPQLIVDSSGQTQQIIVSGGAGVGVGTANIVPLIPVGAGINRIGGNSNNNTTTTVVTTSKQQQESPQSSILRKRALVESVSLKATPVVKDLTQALMVVEREREQQEAQLQLIQQQHQHHHLVAELRDLTGRPSSPQFHSRPPSTDGSTTVSATSSPGLDEQEEEELRAQAYANRNSNAMSGGGHFKPVQGEMHYLQQQQQQQQQPNLREIISLHCTESFPTNLGPSTTLTVVPIASHPMVGTAAGSRNGDGGGQYEQSPRKKARKQLLMPMSEGASGASSGGALGSSALLKTATSSAASSATPAGGQPTLYLSEHQRGEATDERMDTSGSGIVVLGAISSASSAPSGTSHVVSSQAGGGMLSTQALAAGSATHLPHHVSKHNNSISVSVAPSLAGPANLMHNSNVRMDPPSVTLSGQPQGIVTVVAQKTNVTLRKPTNVSLLQSYKQTWKAANNHFQRYTDVKQREERRPTVMDIANQSHILQKVNGWKIFHLSAQIEDMCDLESQAYGKLGQMLRSMESSSGASGSNSSVKPTTDIERINELLKGNMQRSKIIMDGINEARTQIMKIFKHKRHVSDIILRCASKRNFKKREKT